MHVVWSRSKDVLNKRCVWVSGDPSQNMVVSARRLRLTPNAPIMKLSGRQDGYAPCVRIALVDLSKTRPLRILGRSKTAGQPIILLSTGIVMFQCWNCRRIFIFLLSSQYSMFWFKSVRHQCDVLKLLCFLWLGRRGFFPSLLDAAKHSFLHDSSH